MSQRLRRGLAASSVSYMVSFCSSLAITPILLHRLGTLQYGIWLTMASWVTYLSLSTLGLPQATQNRIAEAFAQGRMSDLIRTFLAGFWMTAVMSLIVLAVLGIALATGLVGHSVEHLSRAEQLAAVCVLAISAGCYALTMPTQQCRAVLAGTQHLAFSQTISTLSVVLSSVAGVVTVLLDPSVVAYAVSQGMCAVIIAIVTTYGGARIMRSLDVAASFLSFDLSEARSLLKPSLMFVVIGLSGSIIWGTDNVVISWRLGTGYVAAYAIDFRLTTMASSALDSLLLVAVPVLTALWATDRDGDLRKLAVSAYRSCLCATVLLAVEFLAVGRVFIASWAGKSAVVSGATFGVFVAIFVIRAVAQTGELVVVGTSSQRGYAGVVAAEAVMNVGLTLVLVGPLGVLGVALGTLIAHAACTGWYLPWKSWRLLRIREVRLWRSAIASLLSGGISLAGGEAAAHVFAVKGWIEVAVVTSLILLLYLLVFAFSGLDPGERRQLRFSVRNLRAV